MNEPLRLEGFFYFRPAHFYKSVFMATFRVNRFANGRIQKTKY